MMKVSDIEEMVKVCDVDFVCSNEKSEMFLVLESILQIRERNKKFNRKEWESRCTESDNMLHAYCLLVKGTLEDRLAELAIILFSLAHKYQMNMGSLQLGKTDAKTIFLDDMLMSMVKIELSHYKVYKKIIILVGMLCDYCISNGIDLKWFVKQRKHFLYER